MPRQSIEEQLRGTWTLVSWEQTHSDGTRVQRYGEKPVGIAFFDARGRYIISVMRSDRENYAGGLPWQGTAEESKATADGTITYFGTYTVDEMDSSIAIHIDGSSFPNWNGVEQKRIVAIAGDQLTLTVRPATGGHVDIVWKRVR